MKLISYSEKQIRIKTPSGQEISITDDSFGNTDEFLIDLGRELFFEVNESFSGRNNILVSNQQIEPLSKRVRKSLDSQ